MNFKEIIKQEWEMEFEPTESEEPVEPYGYESSVFQMYREMVERICVRVWNSALELAAEEVNIKQEFTLSFGEPSVYYVKATEQNNYSISINKDSIFKLKIDEQGTDTTEV